MGVGNFARGSFVNGHRKDQRVYSTYREKFAENLKRELPRIPFAPNFAAFAEAGRELARLHLDYEKLEPCRSNGARRPPSH